MARFELLLDDNSQDVWSGRDGEDAARRYVDCHRDAVVVAYREAAGAPLSVLTRGAVIDGRPVT